MKGLNKCLVLGVVLVLFVVMIGFASCGSSYAGLYVNQREPIAFLQLNSDGTFVTLLGFGGSWQVDGNEITFITPLGLETGRIEGNKIIMSGDVWVKKGT